MNAWRTFLILFFGCIESFAILGLMFVSPLWASELVKTIENVKPSIVGVGTVQRTRSPPVNILGTGFVLDDGFHVITNAHVIPEMLDIANKESYTVITGKGKEPEFRDATIVAVDKEHDLALLKISGTALPAMETGRCRQGSGRADSDFHGISDRDDSGILSGNPSRNGFLDHPDHIASAQFKATQCKNDRSVAKVRLCSISARWHCLSRQ